VLQVPQVLQVLQVPQVLGILQVSIGFLLGALTLNYFNMFTTGNLLRAVFRIQRMLSLQTMLGMSSSRSSCLRTISH
jgi:hypothetical protein